MLSNIQRGASGGAFPEAKTATRSPNRTTTLQAWPPRAFLRHGAFRCQEEAGRLLGLSPPSLPATGRAAATPPWSTDLVSSLSRRKLCQPWLLRPSSLPKAPKPLLEDQPLRADSVESPPRPSPAASPLLPRPGPLGPPPPPHHTFPLTPRLRPSGLPCLPGNPPGPSPWTPRSPSAASAPKRSSEASRARSAPHRLGPHSRAMTGSTRPPGQGLEQPAAGVSRSGAGRPSPRTRTGAPGVRVRALPEGRRRAGLAVTPESAGSRFLGPSVCGDCLLRPRCFRPFLAP